MPKQKTTVEAILQTCIQVFRKQGYYRTSMADLAKATGMTKGVFYHHFSNKEEIMLKALEATAQYFDRKVFSIAYQDQLKPQTKLHRMFEQAFSAFTQESGGCLFANTILETAHIEPTFLEQVKVFFQNWEEALLEVYRSQHNTKVARNLARQVIADVEGSLVLMQLYQDTAYLEAALNRAKRLLN